MKRTGLVAAIALALLLACKTSATEPAARSAAAPSIAGTYALVSVAGQPLPYSPSPGVVFVSGGFALAADSTFLETRSISFDGVPEAHSFVGVYSVLGDSVTLRSSEYAAPVTLSWAPAAGTLTAVWVEGVFVYRR